MPLSSVACLVFLAWFLPNILATIFSPISVAFAKMLFSLSSLVSALFKFFLDLLSFTDFKKSSSSVFFLDLFFFLSESSDSLSSYYFLVFFLDFLKL